MNDKTIFAISIKNLKRHKRRTALNIISITFSVGALLFFISFYRGTYIAMMRESFIKYKSGHIQMHTKRFDDKKVQDYVTKDTIIENYIPIITNISKNPAVSGVSGRFINMGFIGNGKEKMVVMVMGCDPEYDKNVSVVSDFIEKGVYLDKSDGILIGKKTAELFDFKIGDICYIQSQTIYNTPNLILLPVVGIYDTGYYELDKNTVFIDLKNANLLFDTNNVINKIIILLKDERNTEKFSKMLSNNYENILDVKTWRFYGQALLENEKGDGIFYIIFMSILIFISITTIMSTMYVNVFERIREIGTLRAIGWKQQEVFKLFIFESIFIGIAGSIVGIILGGIPTLYMTYIGIDYSKMGDVISIPIFKMICKPEYYDLVIVFVLGTLSTYLGGWLPARKASKMIITDSLRTI